MRGCKVSLGFFAAAIPTTALATAALASPVGTSGCVVADIGLGSGGGFIGPTSDFSGVRSICEVSSEKNRLVQ